METIYLASMTASNDIAKERYMEMNKLIELYKNGIMFPEYYDETFDFKSVLIEAFNNNILPSYIYDQCNTNCFQKLKYNENNFIVNIIFNDMVEIYHKLKPCKFELSKEISNTSGSYSTFEGSPLSKGIFQFDMWNVVPTMIDRWNDLREEIKKYGVRNSLTTALMPTATTSQILGNNECFEFFTSNIYTRRTLAGEFPVVNKYLIDDLININMWSSEMKQLIIANNGSIISFTNLPEEIRNLYKTIWEIKQVWVIKAAAARGPYIDQTQSMNIHMSSPDSNRLYASHMTAWKYGLKTGIYYLRSNASKDAQKVTIDPTIQKKLIEFNNSSNDVCDTCSA
jgi:ribonucleoside-diphosphate reductase alpha chain